MTGDNTLKYPATFSSDDGKIVVRFRDIPEAITQGDNDADAMSMAEDVLQSAMEFYFEDRRTVPAPSAAVEGERLVALSSDTSSKVILFNQMIARASPGR